MNNSTTADNESTWKETGFVIDMGSLYSYFARMTDERHARGKRYTLAQICVLAVLAKLSGEDRPLGIAEWVRARREILGGVLNLTKGMPCHNTYRRVLGQGVSTTNFQEQVSAFLQEQVCTGQSVLIAIDGKTMRGTIATGTNQGVHLLAAYLPAEGVVLEQVAVEKKENEIVAAPKLLAKLDLRGKIVMGDAMHTQRGVSKQIAEAGGDYIWLVKDNQPQLRNDIESCFQPETHVKGFSPVPKDFQTAPNNNKNHGRREERTLTTSSLLNDYLDWPNVGQVFKIERRTVNTKTGEVRHETCFGITSLTADRADAKRINSLVRQYWGIENGLHYRRDKSLLEDATRISDPNLAQNMATINNLIVALVRRQGWRYLPEARRFYDGSLHAALDLVVRVNP
jgi:predicted transposase YbfD/YdcC